MQTELSSKKRIKFLIYVLCTVSLKLALQKLKKRKVIKRRIARFDETWCLNSSTCRRKNLGLIYRPKSVGIAKKNCVWRFECGNSRGASLIKWISKMLRNCCFMLEFTPISLRSSSRFHPAFITCTINTALRLRNYRSVIHRKSDNFLLHAYTDM